MPSFGNWITLSDMVYIPIAKIISQAVSDDIIILVYDTQVLEILSKKKDGKYTVIQIDPNYKPSEIETRQSLLTIFLTEA
ncbi:27586_t:CDS:2, partial [Gigaspora margarita]